MTRRYDAYQCLKSTGEGRTQVPRAESLGFFLYVGQGVKGSDSRYFWLRRAQLLGSITPAIVYGAPGDTRIATLYSVHTSYIHGFLGDGYA